uniref:Odorant receptor n=1 Tax=Anomala corpulenta TaxID=931571 RepID=A0A0E3Y5A9_9SCAR|nr:odorant receptor 28 [Anomala corpulenta]
MTLNQNELQYTIINTERRILWANGVYTGKQYPRSITNKTVTIINTILTFTFLTSMLIKMILTKDDLGVVFEIIHMFITEVVWALKACYFVLTTKQFNALEESLKDPVFNEFTRDQKNLVSQQINKTKRIGNIFRNMSLTTCACYILCPILDGDVWAIPLWIPFTDGDPTIYYQLYESICFLSLASAHPSFDMLVIGFLNIMAAQLDILNDNLMNSTDRNEDEDFEVQEAKIKSRLRKCVIHHLAIVRFLSKLERLFSFGIVMQIILSTIAICVVGLQFLRVSLYSGTFLGIMFYFWTMVIEIGLYCWAGQNIITKSTHITTACYTSNWYNCSTSTKKMFFIIMERSKHEIIFRGANFFDISLTTFVMILRKSYSYFAVLVQVYK